MATSSGLSSESCEPQEGKEVVVKCKGDTCTDSGAVPTTPRGVQPPSKEDKNLKEEPMSCKPAHELSECREQELKEGRVGCVVGCGLLGESILLAHVMHVLLICQPWLGLVLQASTYFFRGLRSEGGGARKILSQWDNSPAFPDCLVCQRFQPIFWSNA